MTGRKSLPERVREKALAIHRRNCADGSCGGGPTQEEREQAAREVLGNERKTP